MNLGQYRILNNHITACDYSFILQEIKKKIALNERLLISPLASYTLVMALFDIRINNVLNKFSYLLPDSQWIRISLNFLYGIGIKQTITGTELMFKICDLAQKNKYRLFLYGTTKRTLNFLKIKLIKIFPDLQIVALEPSKYRLLTINEKLSLIRKINRAKPDIFFVALGSPLQEIFSYELLNEKPNLILPIVVVPVGAAFDFISSIKPHAPAWLQRIGFEWLFRLMSEPKRLWKRYLIFGPYFLLLVIRQKLMMKINSTA